MELLIGTLRRPWGGLMVPAVALAALMTTGCSQTLRPEQADRAEQIDVDTFWHAHLHSQPMVTTAEAYRAVLLLADGEELHEDFASRETALMERGIARDAWGLQRNECIDRGSVAYMVCRVIEMRGGIMLSTFGALGIGDRRYAVRELVYREMMEPGAPYRYMTGAELAALMAAADRYMLERGQYESEELDIADMVEDAGGAEQP